MRPIRPLLCLAALLVACGSDPEAAPVSRDDGDSGSGGSAQPNGGASGASSAGTGGVSVAGQAGVAGAAGKAGAGGTTAGQSGAGQAGGGQGGGAAGVGGSSGKGGQAGAAAGQGGSGVPQGGFGGAPPPDAPGSCGPKQDECTCGPSGFGACVTDPKDPSARVCNCKASAKPKEADAVLTCDAAKVAYPSPSWQAITEKCTADQACMAMAPEQAEDLSGKWGDRFCRHYPNPALTIGGVNEGPGKRIYQYCCKPVAPLLPPEPK